MIKSAKLKQRPLPMPAKLPHKYTLSGLRKGRASVTVVTGAGIDAEAGLPTFRGDQGFYEDEEATYLASADALKAEPSRVWALVPQAICKLSRYSPCTLSLCPC